MNDVFHRPEWVPYTVGSDFTDVKVYEGSVTLRQFIESMLSYYPPWLLMLYRARKILAGIDVLSMRKGLDGREGLAVCGSLTGQINIYEIPAPEIGAARKIGFVQLPESLINP